MNWKDISSFSKDETNRTPNVWELNSKNLRILVHRHRHYPDQWLVTCFNLKIENTPLTSKNIDEAKTEAFNIVINYVHDIYCGLKDVANS